MLATRWSSKALPVTMLWWGTTLLGPIDAAWRTTRPYCWGRQKSSAPPSWVTSWHQLPNVLPLIVLAHPLRRRRPARSSTGTEPSTRAPLVWMLLPTIWFWKEFQSTTTPSRQCSSTRLPTIWHWRHPCITMPW
jgi:hypothetical protein